MDYIDLAAELKRLEQENDWGRIAHLSEMMQTFPDLRAVRDEWGRMHYCSAEANGEVDSIEVEPTVHTCDGKPLRVWTYICIDKAGTRLHSDPPVFTIADQNTRGFGEVPRAFWREALEELGLNRFAILKMKDFLERHPPIDYHEGDDADQEGDSGSGV